MRSPAATLLAAASRIHAFGPALLPPVCGGDQAPPSGLSPTGPQPQIISVVKCPFVRANVTATAIARAITALTRARSIRPPRSSPIQAEISAASPVRAARHRPPTHGHEGAFATCLLRQASSPCRRNTLNPVASHRQRPLEPGEPFSTAHPSPGLSRRAANSLRSRRSAAWPGPPGPSARADHGRQAR